MAVVPIYPRLRRLESATRAAITRMMASTANTHATAVSAETGTAASWDSLPGATARTVAHAEHASAMMALHAAPPAIQRAVGMGLRSRLGRGVARACGSRFSPAWNSRSWGCSTAGWSAESGSAVWSDSRLKRAAVNDSLDGVLSAARLRPAAADPLRSLCCGGGTGALPAAYAAEAWGDRDVCSCSRRAAITSSSGCGDA